MAGNTPTSNSDLIAQANSSTGGSLTTDPTPVNDISEIPVGATMYGSGGVSSQVPIQQGGAGRTGLHGTSGTTTQTDTSPIQETTVTTWLNTFYTQISNSPTILQQFSTEAQLAGLVGANANVAQLYSAWQKLIVQAYNHNINGQDISPWDVLANSIPGTAAGTYQNNSGFNAMTTMTAQQAAEIASKASSTDKTTTTQSTETDINYTDPDTARYVLNQASQTLLGRQATNAEVSSFTKSLNANEAEFPKMSQDTKTTDTAANADTTAGNNATTAAAAANTSGTSEVGGQGQTVVGYDSAGNPIYGPTGTTTSTDTSGNSTDTVVSLGEADYTRYGREQLAEDAAKAAPDYGAYQAAGPLMQAFLGTLKGAVSGVGSND
jgi:hypothetical protein